MYLFVITQFLPEFGLDVERPQVVHVGIGAFAASASEDQDLITLRIVSHALSTSAYWHAFICWLLHWNYSLGLHFCYRLLTLVQFCQ